MSTPNTITVGPSVDAGPPIMITDRALRQVTRIFEEEQPGPDHGLRISVRSGGCSGLSYEMDFSPRTDGDLTIHLESIRVFLDAKSSLYLRGTTIDYEGGLRGKGFVFSNPNASKTCRCGESFGV